jgi:hypothetical protein
VVDAEIDPTVEVHGEAGSQNGGPPPGIPLQPPDKRRLEPEAVVAAAKPSVCVPCLIARGAIVVAISVVLIVLVIQERKRKAQGEAKK